jgi:outer membrane protein assembly factor BamA
MRWASGLRAFASGLALLLLLILFVAGLPAALPVFCQDAAAPPELRVRLDAISVVGWKRLSPDAIIAASGLKVGAPVSRVDLQKAADVLSALGPFSSVKYRFSSPPSGLRVEFEVQEAPGLPIRYDNFPWVMDEELNAAVKAAVPLCDGTAPPGGAILDTMATAIELYLEKKNVFARVSHTPMTDPLTDEPIQTFLAAGPAQDVKSIEFSDALAMANRTIQDRLSDLIGKPYSRTGLELFEVEQVRPVYVARGLLKVHFDAPAIQAVAATPGDAAPPSVVTVRVAITPGPAYTWIGAIWSGNSAIATADLAKLVSLKPGDLADGVKMTVLWNRVADEYGHRGFLDAKIDPQPRFDEEAHSVGYQVAIVEGPQYHMGTLRLSGLSEAGEQRVREAWSIKPGAVFDESFFNQFVETGAKNSFVGIPYTYAKIGHYLDKDAASGKVDVMMDFQ